MRIKNIQNRKITFVNKKMNRYMNKNLLAVVAAKFTSQFVLKSAANNYFVCNISLDIFCVAGGGGCSYDYI